MKRIGLLLSFMWVLAIAFWGAPRADAAPMFPDVPDMWAADAVRALAAKGLVEGYPDGTFKGDRAATRYEVAMIVARLLAKEEQDHALFASKADLDELAQLVHQLRDELDAFGVRITNLEDQTAVLDKRVTELERIMFYGSLRAIGVSQSFAGPVAVTGSPVVSGAIGTPPNIFTGAGGNTAIDYSTGRLLYSGVGASARMTLGMRVNLDPNIIAGLEFAAFNSGGSSLVEQYWGVTPPYNANPFLAQNHLPFTSATPFGTGLMNPDDHSPTTQMMFDRFWLQDKANGYQLVLGTWSPQNVGDQVLLGVRNPNVNAPAILPFYGFQVTPLNSHDAFQYEFGGSELPTGSLYNGWLTTASSFYNFERGSFGVSLMKIGQDSYTDGQAMPGGGTVLPTANGEQLEWRDSRTGLLTSVVGPQNEFVWGANFDYDIIKDWLAVRACFGSSRYNPDTTGQFLQTVVNGGMYDGALVGKLGQFKPEIEYLHVDPTYDTIMLPYAVNPALPVFLPYGNWYSADYQLHDYLKYPDNRQGERFTLNWSDPGSNTAAFCMVESLTQVRATTLGQITTPGNVEPLFPMLLTPGDTSIGSTLTEGVGVSHKFDNKLRVTASWYSYLLSRGGSDVDAVKFSQNFYRAGVGYPLTDQLDASLNYTFLDFTGRTGELNKTFTQSIPGFTLSWVPAKNTTVNFNARLFDYTDRSIGANDWHGNQFTVDFNVDL